MENLSKNQVNVISNSVNITIQKPKNNMVEKNRIVNEALRQNVTKEMFLEIQGTFDMVADPVTGLLSLARLPLALKAFDLKMEHVEKFRVPSEIDADKFLEIVSLAMKDTNVWAANEMSEVFRIFDKDQSGFVDRGEIRTIFSRIEENITDLEFEDQLRDYDMNNDGKLAFAEFINMILTTKGREFTFDDMVDAYER